MSVLDLPPRAQWSDPIALRSYRLCPKGPGLYVIGEPRDASAPITPSTEYDAYMGHWPENFRGLYVGISLSDSSGIRGRLSSHARSRGCKGLQSYLAVGIDLNFIYIEGMAATNLEAILVHMRQPEIFPLNRRPELIRQARRFLAACDAADRAAGREIVRFGTIPGYFEDG